MRYYEGMTLTALPATPVAPASAQPETTIDVAEALAAIVKGQQLAGHYPNDDAIDRARRILTGEITREQARAEIARKYGINL